MSRTRLIRPGFFGDEDIAALSRDTRLAYIGLWTLCDDAGYFEHKPRQIAVQLFGYDDDRLELVEKALAELGTAGKVEVLECGKHAVCPKLPIYAQQGGNHAYTFRERHAGECLAGETQPVRTRTDAPPAKAGTARVRTRPDQSSSESVSDSESVAPTKKKDDKEGTVEKVNGGAMRVAPSTAPFLSDLSLPGRPGASIDPGSSPIKVPARLESLTPAWRSPCKDYLAHQRQHRIIDGQAVCEPCELDLAAAGVNGIDPGAQDPLGL